MLERLSAACQRSIASDKARRTRASSKGGRLALKTIMRSMSQGVSLISTLSPIDSTRWSRSAGVMLRNSAMIVPFSMPSITFAPVTKSAW